MKALCYRLILFIIGLLISTNSFADIQSTYYVSPSGNDNNPGTLELPFASLIKARNVVRKLNKTMKGDIIINLRGGTYEQTSTFKLTADDSGSNGFNVIYQAYNCESPVISGGIKIIDWTLHDVSKNIYQAKVDTALDTRQLYVNGSRAIRARSKDASGWLESGDGYNCPLVVESWKNINNVEVVSHKEWKSHRGSIASVDGTHVVMVKPYWTNLHKQFDGPAVWIENAYELLDSEGEWYLDRLSGSLYYKPRMGENMNNVVVIVPRLETLVSGSNLNNIQFKGITFSFATWLFPNSDYGFPCTQADYIGAFQIPGNVKFDHCENLIFENNTFTHLGVSGLQLYLGCKNILINNNTFSDISGSAISLGGIIKSDPLEKDLVKDNIIKNNLIDNIAVEYEGCVGVFVGYTEHTVIIHNEIRHLPYSGISVGWGWKNNIIAGKNNEISNNLIDSVMMILKDGGGIYTLSSQPGAQVHDNYINHQFNTSGSLYPDEGSSHMKWSFNVISNTVRWLNLWTQSIKNDTIVNNFYDNKKEFIKGENCDVRNNVFISDHNWPAKALSIMKNAGRINIPTKDVLLSKSAISLKVGDEYQLTFTLNPCNSTNKEVSWKSKDIKKATVNSNGLVTGISKGSVIISIISNDGLHKEICKVTVI